MTLHKDKASDEAANGDAVRIDQDIKDTSSVAKDASSHLTEEKIENGAEEITSQTELGRPRHGSAEEEEDEDDEQAGVDGKEQVGEFSSCLCRSSPLLQQQSRASDPSFLTPSDEQLRRKRDREGSLEPSLSSSQQVCRLSNTSENERPRVSLLTLGTLNLILGNFDTRCDSYEKESTAD